MYGIKKIIHRYPEPGHSFLPCDRNFGQIEKQRRRQERVFYLKPIKILLVILAKIL